MTTTDYLRIGAGVAAAYLLYQLVSKTPAALKTATAPVAGAIASAWSALTLSPVLTVEGNILFPDGTSTPLAGQTVKTDSDGNVYVLNQGGLYQLGQSDANGNWPASLVLDPNFGVTGTTW